MNPAIIRGEGAILLAQPHAGTIVPPETADGLNARGQRLADTDWRIDRLYEGLLPGATIVRARIHRYVIDANRDPQGGTLYPGRNTQERIALLRAHAPGLTGDRAMAEDIARAAGLLKEGALAECAARRLAAPLLREEPA